MSDLGAPDHPTREARTSVACSLAGLALGTRLAVIALAKVVSELMHDYSAAEDGVGPVKGNLSIAQIYHSNAIGVCGNVA
eukprot:COSAG02_NODE_6256_length_3698_cov_6.245902_2_plen_80_part_00